MATARAWVLNLDADVELAHRTRYEPSRRVRDAIRAHAERLAAVLLLPGDVLVDDVSTPLSARGLPGVAFCPTPRAVSLLRRAGAEPEPHPSVDVLRAVNSRAFASSLGATLPSAGFVTDVEAARVVLDGGAPLGDGWRVKLAFGMAGRNQRVVRSPPSAGDLAFVARGIAQGGVQIEPNVVIDVEYAIHGVVALDGSHRAGDVVRQRCDARGAWVATERIEAGGLTEVLREALTAELGHVARALHAAGYFGPFGIDAYTYRGTDGAACLQPRSEINARYSMGFVVGFGRDRR
jgi:hypothetical protein